ncbi:MAG: M56 family metallopeptidase, partial [Bacteroidota bacterium]
ALAALLVGWQKKSAQMRYLASNVALGFTLLLAGITFILLYNQAEIGMEPVTVIIAEDGEVLSEIYLENEPGWLAQYFNDHLPLIVTAWLMGLVFFILKMFGGLIYIQRLKNQHLTPLAREWQEMLGGLAGELGWERHVKLAESALVRVPMVVGWLKPVILMPIGAVNNLSSEQVEAVLAHELAHISRHDYFLNLLQSLIEAMFYFNPAVWWISASIRTERENCCDDIAVKLCGNSLTYAKALVSLQEMHQAAPAFAMPFASSRNQLLHRIQRILQQPTHKSNVMEKLTATFLLAAAVVLLSVQANTPFGSPEANRATTANDLTVEPEIVPADAIAPEAFFAEIPADSIPKDSTRTWSFRRSGGDEDIEIHFENDEIKSLKINGEEIPKERYGEYEGLAHELMADMENLPEPPAPPSFEHFTPMPPDAPTPPDAPFFEHSPMPFAAPAPHPMPKPGKRHRIVTTDKNGNTTTVIVTEKGDKPVKVKVKDGYIIVDGKKIKKGKKGKTIVIGNLDGEKGDILYLDDAGNEHPFVFALPGNPDMHGFHLLHPGEGDFHLFEPGADALLTPEVAAELELLKAQNWQVAPFVDAEVKVQIEKALADRERALGELQFSQEWLNEHNAAMQEEMKAWQEAQEEIRKEHHENAEQLRQEYRQQTEEMRQQQRERADELRQRTQEMRSLQMDELRQRQEEMRRKAEQERKHAK